VNNEYTVAWAASFRPAGCFRVIIKGRSVLILLFFDDIHVSFVILLANYTVTRV